MIPLWKISLLNTNPIEEFSFSYNEEQKILMFGKKINGEWHLNMKVDASPFFIWGCNNYQTNMRGIASEVIRYYLTTVLSQFIEYGCSGNHKLLEVIKSSLDN